MAEIPSPPSRTIAAIFAAYEADQETGFRDHLGASLIGGPCDRAIFYTFRWATRASHSGRLLRLFETGQAAEPRFVANLRRIGVTLHEVDDATGKQFIVRDDTGHFGGSLDGVGLGFEEAPKAWHVCEFKTHNAKSFAGLVKDGVEKAKPQHFAQMQVYMHFTGIERAFYLAVNKDTDDLHGERVRYDAEVALRLVARAQRIIAAPNPPERLSADPAWFQCRFCDHHAACHGEAMPERHCRSCLHSTPVAGGAWDCARHQHSLTPEAQRQGCAAHLYIPALVPGEQADAGEDWVSYRMPDGSEWRDGVAA